MRTASEAPQRLLNFQQLKLPHAQRCHRRRIVLQSGRQWLRLAGLLSVYSLCPAAACAAASLGTTSRGRGTTAQQSLPVRVRQTWWWGPSQAWAVCEPVGQRQALAPVAPAWCLPESHAATPSCNPHLTTRPTLASRDEENRHPARKLATRRIQKDVIAVALRQPSTTPLDPRRGVVTA